MTKLFNTPFEVSMRILLALLIAPKKQMSLDMITAIDFLTIYSSDFDISDYNLHGENIFSFSEFTSKRKVISESIKELVLKDLVTVIQSEQGFQYKLNNRGKNLCDTFTSDYASEYIGFAQEVWDFVNEKSEVEIINYINNKAAQL
jgi:hypothetical protein